MKPVQAAMVEKLIMAMEAHKRLSGKEILSIEVNINEIIALKYKMEALAEEKGFSSACKESIPICKGECCRWHFPKKLSPVDFFIAVFQLVSQKQHQLADLMVNNQKDQCPMLQKNGCFLTFEQRPVLCTNSYPCFNDKSYWRKKEQANLKFKQLFDAIDMAVFFKQGIEL